MKIKSLLSLSFFSSLLVAQSQLPASLTEETNIVNIPSSQSLPYNGPENIIWSEDFAAGIPSTWSQQGNTASTLWEYRGPNTTPNNTTGSRGVFSGINNVPPTNSPISSSSVANGFVIFDSGFLDNGGSNPLGTGTSPSPHIARLFTDTIDLSADPNVSLNFQSFVRRFQAQFFVAFSVDGGLNYNDTLEVFPTGAVAVNASSTNATTTTLNISSIVGGQSNVVLQFIFDGRLGNANGNGYYYWMLDDIILSSTSSYSFTVSPVGNSPAQDLIYNNDGSYPKYGTMNTNQRVPIQGDMNIINDGTATQNNVKLRVEVLNRSSMQLVHSFESSTGCGVLLPGDTCGFAQTLTTSWTPPDSSADYALVYKAISDSMSANNAFVSTDTFLLSLSDTSYALHAGLIDNYVGTNSAANDIIAIGCKFYLSNENRDSIGSNKVFLDGAYLNLSAQTDSTADLVFAIYDTTGFAFNNGFPAGTTPLFSRLFSLNSSLIGTNSFFDFSNTAGLPLSLNTGTYFLVVQFFPTATNGVVRLANQATPWQNGSSVVMQLGDGNWFGGFTSNALESPHITLNTAQLGCSNQTITINPSACFNDSITSPSGRFTYSQSGTYLDTVQSGSCETYYIVNANFLALSQDSLQVQVCDTTYTSNSGTVYSQSGFYQDTLVNSAGCDSLVYLQLDINQSLVSSDTLVIDTCAASIVSPAGNVLSNSGFYNDIFNAANGCDSTVIIDLILDPTSLSVTSILNGTGLVANQANAQYQWLDCGNSFQVISGDTNQIFTPSQNGTYAVIISKGGCIDTSACTTIADIGLVGLKESLFELYPNPSTGEINLEVPRDFFKGKLEIYSLQGRLVYSSILSEGKKQKFNFNLPQGAYLIKLQSTSGAIEEKVLMVE
jgi:hypothetical protein